MKNFLRLFFLIIISACNNNFERITDRGRIVDGFNPNAYLRGLLPFNVHTDINKTIAQPPIPGLPNTRGIRIPSLLQLRNGRLFVMFDARDSGSSDAAANIDTAMRYSDDNGKTWSVAHLINHFEDFVIKKSGRDKDSASFIDSSPVQINTGEIITLTTMFPGGAGIQGGARHPVRNPFIEKDNKRYIVLTTNTYKGVNQQVEKSTYIFMALATGGPIISITGTNLTAQDVKGYSIDKHWNIFKNNNNKRETVLIAQQGGSGIPKKIHANISFNKSKFRNVRISYVVMNRSRDDGRTWDGPVDISHQIRPLNVNQHYIVSPGIGLRVTEGNYKGRLLYVLYETPGTPNSPSSSYTKNSCNAFSIYSDDNGRTWKQGGYTQQGTGLSKVSESQIVEAPGGQLLMYSRGGPKIGLAHSTDGGKSWTKQIDTGLNNGQRSGTQFGIINLYRTSGANKEWLVAMSHPNDGSMRRQGVLRIGEFKKTGQLINGQDEWVVEWDEEKSSYASKVHLGAHTSEFGYSSIAELINGNLGIFFEAEAPYRANNYAEVKLDRVTFE